MNGNVMLETRHPRRRWVQISWPNLTQSIF